jgi:hypothetical protein
VHELFLAGTEPRESASGMFTAGGALVLPPEYAAWCASPGNTLRAQVRADARILNPPAGTHYVIDPILPPAQQAVEFTSTLPGSVQWSVNGRPIPPQPDGRIFWRLAPGSWQIRASTPAAAITEPVTVE